MAAPVAIVGAGYAGMAAATELAARGIPATVFETSKVLGGRARAVDLNGVRVDNGQHLLIGAYRETLRLLGIIGADPGRLLLRLPLTLSFPGAFSLKAAPLPAPLHLTAGLIGARGLSAADKRAAIGFMRRLAQARFQLAADTGVAQLLDAHRQSARVRQFLWEPLCLAALNTHPERASAQVFANVLRDSLGAGRHASDLLLPTTDLGALFPDIAARFVAGRGGRVLRGTAIAAVSRDLQGYRLHQAGETHGPFGQVILAVAPYHLPGLIAQLPELETLVRQVSSLDWQPIATCYLAYPPATRLAQPMIGHRGGLLQWLFDRGRLGGPEGLFAAVISAAGPHLALGNDELAARLHEEIAAIVPSLPAPRWSRVIVEKRATFACVPGLERPPACTAAAGLLLAGDYVASDYPATLEAAVASGVAAARIAADSVIGEPAAG